MGNLQKDGDPYTGEVYLDTDPREKNRRIRIFEAIYNEDGEVVRYKYETITNEGDPAKVGRRGRISGKTLDKRFKKVSH